MRKFHITSKDGYPLSLHTFDAKEPKAVIQIIHGMEEHQKRYEHFASFLNEQGFTVVTSDLRGHGIEASEPGYFNDKGGYRDLIYDQIHIRAFIRNQYPDIPVYLFAHSMGTIIARVLLQTQSKHYEKVVLSGYPNYQSAAVLGLFCSTVIRTVRGPKYKSKFLQNASTGVFNKSFKDSKTPDDWICSNEEVVNAYQDDPYCGTGFTCSAFNDLYHLVMMMHKSVNYRNIHRSLPILLLRGEEDPCTGGEKGAADSARVLFKAGFEDITEISYPQMRHEILNETGKEEVYQNIAEFYLK